MVSIKEKFHYLENGEIDRAAWLNKAKKAYHLENTDLIEKACELAQEYSKGLTTFYGHPCIEKGLEMGNIVLSLKLDDKSVAAAILISSMQHSKLPIETVTQHLGEEVAQLIRGVQQMEAIHHIPKTGDKQHDQTQIDRLRKLLLAMVSDIRVVLIKLAERTCIMRGIKNINHAQRKAIAQETMDIYAPLANRLGIGQLKWELEDTAFHYADPDSYKSIAKFLAERRADREERIHTSIARIRHSLHEANIQAEVSGRAKHIYSIYLKTKRKDLDYKDIYDCSAIRILVPSLEDCYSALSIVHSLWEHIPKEFDDYIATPKPNGYRSIHTAVVGPDGKYLEIQIRTTAMHEEAERGVAAHWLYKEAKTHTPEYENKIAFLRQLVDWHREVAQDDTDTNTVYDQILSDRVYIFTPAGEILDLPAGATPLDCAYQIHTELGHRCRGAKINAHIVPLTYTLQTGDTIEILTHPNGTPSRDWMNLNFGYITTARAKAKIAHWFRTQDMNQHIESGKRIIEREFSRLGTTINIQKIATQLGFKNEDIFLASLGRGQTRVAQIQHILETEHEPTKHDAIHLITKKTENKSKGMNIAGVSDLMTRIARCCKPIPGDNIVGFITQGRGVSIHKLECNNIAHIETSDTKRLIPVSWDSSSSGTYYVDLQIKAHIREKLLKEVANFLANNEVDLLSLNSTVNRNKNLIIMTLTIQISALSQLTQILSRMGNLPGVIEAKRLNDA